MSQTKKIITNVIESVGEAVKESIEQVAASVDPVKMIDNSIGINRNESEFSKYLKGLGGELTPQQLEQKKKEYTESQTKEMENAQKIISRALPEHLRPKPKHEPDEFEKQKQEEEMKKAQMVEAQKRQQAQQFSTPTGKSTGRSRKRPKSADFEAQKNVKVG